MTQYTGEFLEHTQDRFTPSAAQLEDATWLSHRLAELLPLPLALKQELLELNGAHARLSLLRTLIEGSAQEK